MDKPLALDDLTRDELLSLIRSRQELFEALIKDGCTRILVADARVTERDIFRAKLVGVRARVAACARQHQAAEDEWQHRFEANIAATSALQKALTAGAPRARLDRLAQTSRTARRLSDDADDARQKLSRQLDRLRDQADALWERMEGLK